MKRLLVLASLCLGGCAAAAQAEDNSAEDWADIIQIELGHRRPMPVLSVYYDELNLESAYDIQRALVRRALEKHPLGGYKAAFSTADLRQKYHLSHPLVGVLFADGTHPDGATVELTQFVKPMLEINLGFTLRSPITRHIVSADDLLTYLGEIVPVIDIPDLNYLNPGGLNSSDFVATNLGSGHYVVGKAFGGFDLQALNALKITLYRDDALIDEGSGCAALGDQVDALLWLVNAAVAHGWPLRAGQLLLTGRLGGSTPAAPGRYRGDFGAGHGLSFSLVIAPPTAANAAQIQP